MFKVWNVVRALVGVVKGVVKVGWYIVKDKVGGTGEDNKEDYKED